jgi:glyoxylase-like metal-dependent hydrolase (beta-lactamase superfamily II)
VLNHINTWVLDDGDQYVLVDTGFFTGLTRDTWKGVLAGLEGKDPVSRVLVTHLHPDHVGCAGWLCERLGVDLYMTREEYLLCRILVADTGQPAPEEGRRFYHAAGFSGQQLSRYVERFGSFGQVVSPLPHTTGCATARCWILALTGGRSSLAVAIHRSTPVCIVKS